MVTSLRRLALAALLLLTTPARADLPPPRGLKNVGYSFKVTGIDGAGAFVLFAYPCGGGSGAPRFEHRVLVDGETVVTGRRGGNCTLYAVARPVYDAWKKSFVPQDPVDEDPAVKALVGQARRCQGGPTPLFETSSSDSRDEIEETLMVKSLDAASCVVVAAKDVPAPRKGRFGCAVTPGRTVGAGGFAAVALVAAALARRRSRSRTERRFAMMAEPLHDGDASDLGALVRTSTTPP